MTRQIRDKLIFENNEYHLNQNLLAVYFKNFPEKNIKPKYVITALWRGYIATFKIIDDQLFVMKIEVLIGGKLDFELLKEFEYKKPCDWYSGYIRIDEFKGEFNDEKNTKATYEFLEIENGKLKNKHSLDYNSFIELKNLHYDKFKQTETYSEWFSNWKKSELSEKEIEEIIYESFMFR